MSAVCPKCGVAVVAGYVKCPKCHAALPAGSGRGKHATFDPGGTSVKEAGRFPLGAVLAGALVAGGIIVFFASRSNKKPAVRETSASINPIPVTHSPAPAQATTNSTPVEPPAPAVDPSTIASQLQHALQKQRLWSTVEVVGARVDVRSRSCTDPNMAPLLNAAAAAFHDARVTKLRCLETSGSVVFARDL